MANTFKREVASLTTADTPVSIYSAPAATTTVVIGFVVSNMTAGSVAITVEVAGTNLGTDIAIPPNSVLSVLDGKIVLEATDEITVECDTLNGVDVILSIMEIT